MLKALLLITPLVGFDHTVEMPSMEECLDARVTIAEQNPDVKTLCIPTWVPTSVLTADESTNTQEFFGIFMNIIDKIIEKESDPNKKDGPWVAYYPNGQLRAQGTYKNGELDGPYISYYENGQLEEQGNYKDGKEVGLWVYYFENGQLRSEGIYSSKMTPSEALRTP